MLPSTSTMYRAKDVLDHASMNNPPVPPSRIPPKRQPNDWVETLRQPDHFLNMETRFSTPRGHNRMLGENRAHRVMSKTGEQNCRRRPCSCVETCCECLEMFPELQNNKLRRHYAQLRKLSTQKVGPPASCMVRREVCHG